MTCHMNWLWAIPSIRAARSSIGDVAKIGFALPDYVETEYLGWNGSQTRSELRLYTTVCQTEE